MKKSKILIVEDEAELRETWELMLENFDLSPHTASNGLEAVRIMEEYPVDIIITDLQMPVKDGFFVLDYIKSNNLDIITWVCTGQISPNAVLANYNVDKILLKPFSMLNKVQELISIINKNNANKTKLY